MYGMVLKNAMYTVKKWPNKFVKDEWLPLGRILCAPLQRGRPRTAVG